MARLIAYLLGVGAFATLGQAAVGDRLHETVFGTKPAPIVRTLPGETTTVTTPGEAVTVPGPTRVVPGRVVTEPARTVTVTTPAAAPQVIK